MEISLDDIEYCAIIFHNPVYMILFKLSENLAELYNQSLTILPRYNKSFAFSNNGIVLFIIYSKTFLLAIFKNFKKDVISTTMVINLDNKKDNIDMLKYKLEKFMSSKSENKVQI